MACDADACTHIHVMFSSNLRLSTLQRVRLHEPSACRGFAPGNLVSPRRSGQREADTPGCCLYYHLIPQRNLASYCLHFSFQAEELFYYKIMMKPLVTWARPHLKMPSACCSCNCPPVIHHFGPFTKSFRSCSIRCKPKLPRHIARSWLPKNLQ